MKPLRKSFICALFFVCIVASVGSVAETSHQQSPQRQSESANTIRAKSQTFRGAIDERLQIEMKLRREGNTLEGSYFYEKIKKEIALRGSIDTQGDFTLQEFDATGKQTGLFKGVWGISDTGDAELKGTWSKPGATRQLKFVLAEIPVDLPDGVRLVSREIKRENKLRRYTIEAEYPQIEGGAGFENFNRTARELAVNEVKGFERDIGEWEDTPYTKMGSDLFIGYDVGLASDAFISVQFQIGTYFAGAAHPNSHTKVVNYDIRRNRALTLAELFKRDAPYLQKISEYSVADLKKQFRQQDYQEPEIFDISIEEGAAPSAENYESWLITRGGLEITFDAYQVAPYAAGPQRVVVPYSILREMIDPQGPLARFIN